MFSEPDRKLIEFNSEQAWTWQERKAASALSWIVAWFVGAPSLAVAIISSVFNASFAYGVGSDWQEKVAWTAASLALSALVIGIPIARPYLRERRPEVAAWALWLWLALLGFSTLGTAAFLFAGHDRAPVSVPQHGTSEIAGLESERDAIGGVPGYRDCADGRARECRDYWDRGRELALIERAGKIEDRIAALLRAPRTELRHDAAVPAPNRGSVLQKALSAFVALLIQGAAAIGLWIAAESYVAILREKTVTPAPPVQPKEEPQPISFATGVIELGKDTSFVEWANRCLSIRRGARVTAADAISHYETWCARNGISALTPQMFGKRMTEWLGRNGGQIGHSNGRYYEGVALVEQASPELLTDA